MVALAFVSLPGYTAAANVELGEPRLQCSSEVPLAFDAVRLIIRPMALLVNGPFILVQPPLESVAPAVQHKMDFGQIQSPRCPPSLLPPEIDAGAISHPVRANQATVIRPLACQTVLEAVPIRRSRQKLAGNVQPILPAVTPATTNAAVKQEFTIRVEKPVADDRTTKEILHALRRSGRMSVSDAHAGSRGDGTSESRRAG